MKKFIVALLCMSVLITMNAKQKISSDKQKINPFYSYTPEGKHFYTISLQKILVRFTASFGFEQQAKLLQKYHQLLPLQKQMLLPSPRVCILELKEDTDEAEVLQLIESLKHEKDVLYANAFLINEDGTLQGITETFYVKLKQANDISLLEELAERNKIKISKLYVYDKLVYFCEVNKKSKGNALTIANQFAETKQFACAEPDFLLLLKKFSTNDSLISHQWALHNIGSAIQYNGTPGADMNVFDAWTITTGSSSIKVAVIDEGVDLLHPDLLGNLVTGFDATLQGSAGACSGNDAHGTACAGIIAASGNNTIGIAGVAYTCKIIPVRFAYTSGTNWVTSNSWISSAIDWAWDQGGADVLSNSWGGGASSTLINDAITRATTLGRNGKGAPVFFAAGNNNSVVEYPASLENVISVTAMSMCNQRKNPSSCDGETSWGSNHGINGDVAAPGVKIYTCDISGTNGNNSGDYISDFGGTSAATPNAAGVMALILSMNPTLTMSQARQVLESGCDKVGGYAYNMGVTNQPNGSWSNDLGYGKINAYTSLQLASTQPCNNTPSVAIVYAVPNQLCAAGNVALSLSGIILSSTQTYQWQWSSDNISYQNITGATSFNYNPFVSSSTWYRCEVTCGTSVNSIPVFVVCDTIGISSFPSSQSFDILNILPCGWSVEDKISDGNSWVTSNVHSKSVPNNIKYSANPFIAADDWLYSPPLTLAAGTNYRVQFWYKAGSSVHPNKLEIKWGNAATHSSMGSSSIFSNANIMDTNYVQGISSVFTPSSNGIYYVGFRVFSEANAGDLHLDDIIFETTQPCMSTVIGGSISGSLTATANTSQTYTLSGYTGNTIQWEQSIDNGITYTAIPGATASTATISFQSGVIQLRARVSSASGTCPDAFSNSLTIQVSSLQGDDFLNPIQAILPFNQTYSTSQASGYTSAYVGIDEQPSADIFFKFTTGPCADTILVSSCGSDFDTYIHLLDSNGNQILSSDDYGPDCNSTEGSIKTSVTPNTVYYAVFEGYSSNTGNLIVKIEESNFVPCNTTLNVKLYLQGYYSGAGKMTPAMFNAGLVGSDSTDVDDIFVSLHDDNFPYSSISSTTARLKRNGLATCILPLANGNFYISVKHKNTIETWSKFPVSFPLLNNVYDFSVDSAKAFENNMIEVEPTIWAFFTGEIFQDDNIDLIDMTSFEADANNFLSGYQISDLNGDGNVDLLDSGVLENNINHFIFSQHP